MRMHSDRRPRARTLSIMILLCGLLLGLPASPTPPALAAPPAPVKLILTPAGLTVDEGGTAAFQVRLDAKPAFDVTLAVTRASGDADLAVQSGAAITIDRDDWATPAVVTLRAAEDADAADGTATFQVGETSLNAIAAATLTAAEYDNDKAKFVTGNEVLPVPEGAAAVLRVFLDSRPTTGVSFTVTRVSGDGDLAVSTPGPEALTPANWSSGVAVTIAAAADGDAAGGTAVFRIHATNATLPDLDFTAREIDSTAGSILVGGPIGSDTVWNDTTQDYVVRWPVVVPAGVTLTIGPGVRVRQGGLFTAFSVSGNLVVQEGAALALRTYTPSWMDPSVRNCGVAIEAGGTGTFNRALIQAIEMSSEANNGVDNARTDGSGNPIYWSAIVHAAAGSSLTARGCTFEGLSRTENWVVPYGLHMEPTAAVTVTDSTSTLPAVRSIFRNVQAGIGWIAGSGVKRVDASTFSGCTVANVRIWGDAQSNLTLRAPDCLIASHAFAFLNVKNGCTMTVAAGAGLRSEADHWLTVDAGGRLVLTQANIHTWGQIVVNGRLDETGCMHWCRTETPHWTDLGARRNGVVVNTGGQAAFDRTTFQTWENNGNSNNGVDNSSQVYWAGAIHAKGTGSVTVRGCQFQNLAGNSGYHSPNAIRLDGTATAVIEDSPTPAPARRNSFDGYQSGIEWECGAAAHRVEKCDFTNCTRNIRIWGNSDRDITVNNVKTIVGNHDGAFLAMKAGTRLALNPGSAMETWGWKRIQIASGATMSATNAAINLAGQIQSAGTVNLTSVTLAASTFAPGWTDPGARQNGIELTSGGSATLRHCSFYFSETQQRSWWREYSSDPNWAEWAAMIYARLGAGFTIDHCAFNHAYQPATGYPTTYAIRTETRNNWTVTGCVFAKNYVGLGIYDMPATANVSGNDFQLSGNTSIYNATSTILNAPTNYWGDPSGPAHMTNPGGTGGRIGDNVNFAGATLNPTQKLVEWLAPASAQEAGGLTTQTVQLGVELFGLRALPYGSRIDQLAFRLSSPAGGMAWSMLANFRLAFDANNDGAIGATETTLAGGTPTISADGSDQVILFNQPFTTPATGTAGYILLADAEALPAGAAFTVGLDERYSRVKLTYGVLSRLGTVRHVAGNYVVLTEPRWGQEPNNMSSLPEQAGVELFGFRLLGGGRQVERVDFQLYNLNNINPGKFTSLRLYMDSNLNGRWDAADALVDGEPNGFTTNPNNRTGVLTFAPPPSTMLTNRSYLLVGDLWNLSGGDSVTIGLGAGNIDLVGTETVTAGALTAATQTVAGQILLSPTPGWTPPAALSTRSAYPLLGFQMEPTGRALDGLIFELGSIQGIAAGEITNARIYWDRDGNNAVGGADLLLASGGQADIQGGVGAISFAAGFSTRGRLILAADIAAVAAGDELTIGLTPDGVLAAGGAAVSGAVRPVRHLAGPPPQEGHNKNMQWTLAWRSPGGTAGSGRFNHGGDKVIIGYNTGSAWIYDAGSNTPRMMLKEHYDSVRYAGFSSDDTAAVTVSKDGAVHTWDLRSSGTLRSAMFSDLLVDYAVPSPDFRKLMVITQGKGLLLDLETQQRLWEFIPGGATVNAIAYSPDGKHIAIGASDKRAYMLEAATGGEKWRFIGHSQAVTGVAFTGDGQKFMTASADATVQLWKFNASTNRWTVARTISLSGQNAQGTAVTSDGQRVCMITGNGDQAALRMFDGATGLELYAINLNSASGNNWGTTLENVAFDDAGQRVMVASSGEGWCQTACFRVGDGMYLTSWGPRGALAGDFEARPRISADGERIFYHGSGGMNLLHRRMGVPIRTNPRMYGNYRYGLDRYGTRMAWVQDNAIRVDSISDTGFAPMNNVPFGGWNNSPVSLSPDGTKFSMGDYLFESDSGRMIANYSGVDGPYHSGFSADGYFWGFALADSLSMITLLPDDPTATLYNLMHTDYRPFKILWHPDRVRVGCVNRDTGVQFYDMDIGDWPVGLYRWDAPDQVQDASLSEDGSLLLIAGHNLVKLYDMTTGRVLRYFYPMHSSLTDVWALSAQFAKNDTQIAIAWNYNYVEVYERSQAKRIEVTPAVRHLAPGQKQAFQVEIVYDDTTRRDVTPRDDQEDTSVRLEIIPPAKATIVGNLVTVAPGATGSFTVRARYREDGQTLVGDAVVTIGAATLLRLVADPDKLAVTPGVFRPITYTAMYNDGYEADVTADVQLAADKPEDVEIEGQNVKVLYSARPGRITVTGSYKDPWNAVKTAQTVITVFGPRTAWERFAVTGGGNGTSGALSPDGTQLAAGSSSGAVNLYATGATPTQYALRNIIPAHSAPIVFVGYLDDSNSQIVTVGQDGAIKTWAVDTPSSVPLSVYQHDAQIQCAALAYEQGRRYVTVGDTMGRVALVYLNESRILWKVAAHTGEARTVAIDGDTVLSGGADGRLKLFERANGRLIATKTAHTKPIVKVGYLPLSNDAPGFYSLGEDKTLVRWNKGNQTIAGKPFEYSALPTTAAVFGSTLYVATSGPPAAWVYNKDGLLLRWLELPPAEGSITHLMTAGGYLLTGRSTGKKTVALRFMGLEAGEEEVISPFSSFQFFEGGRGIYRGSLAHSFPLTQAHSNAEGTKIFTQDPKRTMSWTLANNTIATATRLLETGAFIAPSFEGMDFTADSGLLVTRVGISHYMINTNSNLLWKTLHTPGGGPFAISPLGTRLATADFKTRLWDIANLSMIDENSHLVTGMDFIGETKFLGAVNADRYLGVFNASNIMDNGVTTRHAPRTVGVNRAKDRAIVVSEEIRGGGFMEPRTCDYYAEIYDIKNLSAQPRLLFDIYLCTVTEDPFGQTRQPSFCVAVSEDTGMALVGSSGDRPVKLIQMSDGATIREFNPPAGRSENNIGASSVEFLPGDRGVMIGWGEGYAELWRRIPPLDLGLQLSEYVPPKFAGKPAERKPLAAENARYKVRPGQTLWIESLARYVNGNRLNVTPSTTFTSSAPAVAVVSGSVVTISPLASPQIVSISARYVEVGKTLTTTIELEIVGTPVGVTGISRSGYALDYLDPGKKLYGDAASTFTLPIQNDLLHQLYIRTRAADANLTTSTLLSFTINQPARIVVAIDSQMTQVPTWLAGWTELTSRLTTTDPHPQRRLFEKIFAAGKVNLGGNRNSGAPNGARMYNVIIANPDVGQVGTVEVRPTPAGGRWRLDGPFNLKLEAAGTTSVTNLPTGSYKLTWLSLADWYTPHPAESTAYLGRNAKVTFSGKYMRHTGTVIVNTLPATVPWEMTDPDGKVTTGVGNRTILNVPTGTVSLKWQPLANYSAPGGSPVTQTLDREGQVTFTGIYLPQNDTYETNANRIVQYLLGMTGPETWWMDANQDTTITIADVLHIYEHANPQTPTLLKPAEGATSVDRTVTFDWSDCRYADSYDFYLWKEGASEPTLPTAGLLKNSSYKPATPLAASTVYYWRVRSKNPNNSATSSYGQFRTK